MYAIFRAKGKQFRAEPDATIRLPSLEAEPGDRLTFDEVLLAADDGDVRVGTPALDGASVAAEVVRHGKGDKIVVFKMKRRKNYRRKQGHRQGFTEIRVLEIQLPGAKGRKKAAKPAEEPKAEEPEVKPAAEAEAEVPAKDAEPTAATDVDITGAARELAEEHGLDLSGLEGTGKEGRILKGDVEKAIQARQEQEEEGK